MGLILKADVSGSSKGGESTLLVLYYLNWYYVILVIIHINSFRIPNLIKWPSRNFEKIRVQGVWRGRLLLSDLLGAIIIDALSKM